jgi:hypothetical protein
MLFAIVAQRRLSPQTQHVYCRIGSRGSDFVSRRFDVAGELLVTNPPLLVPAPNGFSVPQTGQRAGSPWLRKVIKGWFSQ